MPPTPVVHSPTLPTTCIPPGGQRLSATSNPTTPVVTQPTALPPTPFFGPQLAQAVMSSMMNFYPGQTPYPQAPNPFLCLPGQDIPLNAEGASNESQQQRRILAAIASHHAQQKQAEKEQIVLRSKSCSPTE